MRRDNKRMPKRHRRSREAKENYFPDTETDSGEPTPDDSDDTFGAKGTAQRVNGRMKGLYDMVFPQQNSSQSGVSSSSYDGTVPSDECSGGNSTDSDDEYDDDDWDGDFNADCIDTLFSRNMDLIRCSKTGRNSSEVQVQMRLPSLPLEYMDQLLPTESGLNEAMETMKSRGQEAFTAKWNFNYGPLEEQILEQDEVLKEAALPGVYKSLFESHSDASSQEDEEVGKNFDENQNTKGQLVPKPHEVDVHPERTRNVPEVPHTGSLPCEIVIREQQSDISSEGSFDLTPLERQSLQSSSPDEAVSSTDREDILRAPNFGISTSQTTSCGKGSRQEHTASPTREVRNEKVQIRADNLNGRISSRSRHGLERIVNRDYRMGSPKAVILDGGVGSQRTTHSVFDTLRDAKGGVGSQRKGHTVFETLLEGTARARGPFLEDELPSFDEGAHRGAKCTEHKASAVNGELSDSKGTRRTTRSIWVPGKREQLDVVDNECPSFDELEAAFKTDAQKRRHSPARERNRQSPSGISISINHSHAISEISTYGVEESDKSDDQAVNPNGLLVKEGHSSPTNSKQGGGAASAPASDTGRSGAIAATQGDQLSGEETPFSTDGDDAGPSKAAKQSGYGISPVNGSKDTADDSSSSSIDGNDEPLEKRRMKDLDGNRAKRLSLSEDPVLTSRDIDCIAAVVQVTTSEREEWKHKSANEPDTFVPGDHSSLTRESLVETKKGSKSSAISCSGDDEKRQNQIPDNPKNNRDDTPSADSSLDNTDSCDSAFCSEEEKHSLDRDTIEMARSGDRSDFRNLVFDSHHAFRMNTSEPDQVAGGSRTKFSDQISLSRASLENDAPQSPRSTQDETKLPQKATESPLGRSIISQQRSGDGVGGHEEEEKEISYQVGKPHGPALDISVSAPVHHNDKAKDVERTAIEEQSSVAEKEHSMPETSTVSSDSDDDSFQSAEQSNSFQDGISEFESDSQTTNNLPTFKGSFGKKLLGDDVSSYTRETFARYYKSLHDKNSSQEAEQPVEQELQIQEEDCDDTEAREDEMTSDSRQSCSDEDSREATENEFGEVSNLSSEVNRVELTYVGGVTTPHMTTISELEISLNPTLTTIDAPSLITAPTLNTLDTPLASTDTFDRESSRRYRSMYFGPEQREDKILESEDDRSLAFKSAASQEVPGTYEQTLTADETKGWLRRNILVRALVGLAMFALGMLFAWTKHITRLIFGSRQSNGQNLVTYPSIPFESNQDRAFTRQEPLQDRVSAHADDSASIRTDEVGTCETFVVPGLHVDAAVGGERSKWLVNSVMSK